MKNFKIKLISLVILLSFLILPYASYQAQAQESVIDQMKSAVSGFDLPTGGDDAEITALAITGRLIQVFLSLFGIIFFILMIYGGYKWMIASGREEEIKNAKDTIRSAIIGLVIVIMAYAISFFIVGAIQNAASTT